MCSFCMQENLQVVKYDGNPDGSCFFLPHYDEHPGEGSM